MATISEAAYILQSEVVGKAPGDLLLQQIYFDSRTVLPGDGNVFFALKGEKGDGHKYLEDAYRKGIRVFVVEKPAAALEDAVQLVVKNSMQALHALAQAHRDTFQMPVIGVTGSYGKTIVKEWLFQVASIQMPVVKSPRSYNSQLGVPVSVWQIEPYHKLGIFEAGISRAGEMGPLARVIAPTVGVFTHLGAAHDDGFKSREEKLAEKWLLFSTAKDIVFCADEEVVAQYAQSQLKTGQRLHGWRISRPAQVSGPRRYTAGFDLDSRSYTFKMPFGDAVSVENAFHVAATLLVLGFTEIQVQEGLLNLRSVHMRLEWKEGLNNNVILDDTWINDADGFAVALSQMQSLAGSTQSKTIILSDLSLPGQDEEGLYKKVGKMSHSSAVDRSVLVGERIGQYASHFPGAISYPTVEDLLASPELGAIRNSYVLVKGARRFSFERIVARLEKSSHATRLEISLNAIISNFNYFKSKVRPKTKIMAMVKASAYGSGSVEIANVLQLHHVDYLTVAYPDEGIELRRSGITVPMAVMNCQPDHFESLIRYKLEPVIYSLPLLKEFSQFASDSRGPLAFHLEVNTGMNRLGLDEEAIKESALIIKTNQGLSLSTVFSHLSAAEDPQFDAFTKAQISRFNRMTAALADYSGKAFSRHLSNTAGISRWPEAEYEMVRLGIGLYGVDVAHTETGRLQQIGKLKTQITQLRNVKAGESVGYGRRGISERDRLIGVLAIGYADGLSRQLGNGRYSFRVNGRLAPTVGSICMDMTMVDLTGIPCLVGDEASLFDEVQTLDQMAEIEGTIPYEILTRIGPRVKRIFVSE